jgi:LytR cell envelope-related transcriptional attenuator
VDSTINPYELIRPWRRATLLAGTLAVLEFVVLVVVGVLVLTRPSARGLPPRTHAHAPVARVATSLPQTRAPGSVGQRAVAQPRARLRILVLNGNGRNGAAGAAASRLQRLGYRIAGTANAPRQNYATTLVMYRSGYRAAGLRLARDLGAHAVWPLDGIAAQEMRGGELAVILGA